MLQRSITHAVGLLHFLSRRMLSIEVWEWPGSEPSHTGSNGSPQSVIALPARPRQLTGIPHLIYGHQE